ncbi:hypothetical protein MG293_014806 [Ovis ammon polii]|uniref:Uncharacterized protein n=1 Tax=Ovis ammon polii TaxID=230172 RepID=A0AAD4U1Q3_OVIAM|nr:hypothetical protein MG293_014806 [Ovis ammon polii]
MMDIDLPLVVHLDENPEAQGKAKNPRRCQVLLPLYQMFFVYQDKEPVLLTDLCDMRKVDRKSSLLLNSSKKNRDENTKRQTSKQKTLRTMADILKYKSDRNTTLMKYIRSLSVTLIPHDLIAAPKFTFSVSPFSPLNSLPPFQ